MSSLFCDFQVRARKSGLQPLQERRPLREVLLVARPGWVKDGSPSRCGIDIVGGRSNIGQDRHVKMLQELFEHICCTRPWINSHRNDADVVPLSTHFTT